MDRRRRLLLMNNVRAKASGGAAVPALVVSGTAIGGITAAQVVTGGKIATLTLTRDTWLRAASQMSIAGGNNQQGGGLLPTALTVLVGDAGNNPVAGITVTFAVTAGGGSVGTASAVTNGSGIASSTWTLGPSGTQTVTATSAGLTGSPLSFSATVTTNLYPNQPAGLTPFAELDFSGLPAGHGNTGVLLGDWWTIQNTPSNAITTSTDVTVPQTSPYVLSYATLTGTQSGYSGPPVSGTPTHRYYGGWAQGATESSGTEYKEIYESLLFKIPTASYETQKLGIKVFGYWGVGQMAAQGLPVQIYNAVQNSMTNDGAYGVNDALDLTSWGPIRLYITVPGLDRSFTQNIAPSATINFQVWHQWELHLKLNSTTSAADGVLELWVDNVLLAQYTDVQFNNASYPHGFWGRHVDQVWGSQGTVAKLRDDSVLFGHQYLSGVLK